MNPNTARTLGFALVAVGALLAVIGLIALIGGGDPAPTTTTSPVAAPTTQAPPVTVATTAPTTTATPTTIATTTTAAPTTTTTTMAPTTTTSAAPPTTVTSDEALIQEFVVDYAAATEADDVDFLYERIHPAVIATGGEELCRNFVAAEIVLISDYQLTGPITGPVELLENILGYTAQVMFTFQGQSFTDNAQFAIVDGEVRWFTVCR